MSFYEISSDVLKVKLCDFGGEMHSAVYGGKERIWGGNPDFWKCHAPFLFPIVGRLNGNKTQIGGSEYCMNQHGLARIYKHKVVASSDSFVEFCFSSSEETLLAFPFEFEFFTRYEVIGSKVDIQIRIVNKGVEVLPCSVGAHTAFSTALYSGDTINCYELVFEKEEDSLTEITMHDGLVCCEIPHTGGKTIAFTEQLLNDTIVLKGVQSDSVSLVHKGSGEKATANLVGHDLVAFWKAPGGDFICIEPWNGIADPVEFADDFSKKPYLEMIETEKTFDFSISFE